MLKWEYMLCFLNTLLNNAVILFRLQNMLLRCCIIHFSFQILFFQKWIHHFGKFIIAVDLGDIKTTYFVDCQKFVHTTSVYGHSWFSYILCGLVLYLMGNVDSNFSEFNVNPSIENVRYCCTSRTSVGISTMSLTSGVGLLLVFSLQFIQYLDFNIFIQIYILRRYHVVLHCVNLNHQL